MDSVVATPQSSESPGAHVIATPEVFGSLGRTCGERGLISLTERLAEISLWLENDLADVERGLVLIAKNGQNIAEKSARHLLDRGGKRLRPICVALAANMGSGFGPAARAYAIAVELVHNATLLHDDVVDLGDLRRGVPAARVIYGNAASIFGGDWLLVEALSRIMATGIPGVMERMLEVIREMVIAETWQLERRGRVHATAREYFDIARGKTAALFRWAMFAGARAGGTSDEVATALEEYGTHLGIAFQIVDDVLDFDLSGNGESGKTLFSDLREGKMTYPLILAMAHRDELLPLLEQIAGADGVDPPPELVHRVAAIVRETRAPQASIELAEQLCRRAIECLGRLPSGRARDALADVALSTPWRRK